MSINDDSKDLKNNMESPPTTIPTSSSGWSWTSFVDSASKFADKAQEIAEIARISASEKANILVQQANDIRINYDVEAATNILMSTIGATPFQNISTESSGFNNNIKTSELDLTYITENVVAMAFPYDINKAKKGDVGNDINVVSAYLNKKHTGHYMVWNVSEEVYDYSLFNDQVLEYKFPGHPAPPLGLLFKICTAVENWLDADAKNIAVIHCLTGKGRTATLISCILTWLGEFSSPIEALQYVADRRKISISLLTIPSQCRYVHYFSNMLDSVKPRFEPLLLRRVIVNSIPKYGNNKINDVDNIGCCPYIQVTIDLISISNIYIISLSNIFV